MHDQDVANDLLPIKKIGPYQIAILILGILVLFADGFDAQMVGYVAPAISAAWQVSPATFAPVFAANVFGLMIGSMSIAPIADIFGRKYITTACVAIFAVSSLLTVFVTQIGELAVIRFVSGLALGGAMPCMIAAASDYFPARYRTRVAVLMATAWSLGIGVCGLTTSLLVQTAGWQSLFLIGGVLPLVLAPLMLILLPESPHYLIRRGQIERLNAILKRLDPSLTVQNPAGAVRAQKFPIQSLFEGNLAKVTPFVWLAYFCSGATVYFFLNWLPIFVNTAGYTPAQSAYVGALYQIGGLVGGILISILVDRWGAAGLTLSLTGAGFAVAALGISAGSLALLGAGAALAGVLVVGSQNSANAYTGSRLYPSEIRATGLGCALAFVRFSGVLAGSLGAGFLLSLNLGPTNTMLIIGIPEVLAAGAFYCVHQALRGNPARTTPSKAMPTHG